MKKQGVLLIEGILSLIIIIIVSTSIFLSLTSIKNIYTSYQHNSFKSEFVDIINLGKFRAVNDSSRYTLKFFESSISLVDSKNKLIKKYYFPSSIKMIKFNGINNRSLDIKSNGVISRGATFVYSFNGKSNKITIATITGKVNYDKG